MKTGKKGKRGGGGSGFMMLYANLMMLLMTFFIILVSLSTMQEEKIKLVGESFEEFLATGGKGILWGKKLPLDFDYLIEQEKSKIRAEISANLRRALRQESELEIETSEGAVVIKLSGELLFELGKAELKTEAKEILKKVVPLLKEYPYSVCVQGHTDNLPIHSQEFSSNWQLSAIRAINVVKYLEEQGIDKDKLIAAGYGEYRPLVSNDTPEHRALNRRVEMAIIVSST